MVGAAALAEHYRHRLYGDWVNVARSHADFIGIQTYTRILVGPNGPVAPPAGAEMTAAGYEFYPAALANTIRWAHGAIGKPIYVTESGIATDDDTRRIVFIDGLTGAARLHRRGNRRPQLSLLVAARQFRMGGRLRRPFRAGGGRPEDFQADAETQRVSLGGDCQGQSDLTIIRSPKRNNCG